MPTIPSDFPAAVPLPSADLNLILAALRLAAAGNTVGIMDVYYGATAPDGSLLCSGQTIGSASSGATARANADMSTLFTHLWNETTNAEHVIQDSAGTPTTRGASAAADFAANKRMPLPDMRGRDAKGKDNMGGTSANRVTAAAADTLGAGGGVNDALHTHSITLSNNSSNSGGIGECRTTVTGSDGAVAPYTTVNWIIWTGVDW